MAVFCLTYLSQDSSHYYRVFFFFLFDVRLTLSDKGGLPDTCDTGLLAGTAHTQAASGGTNEVTMWTDCLISGPCLFLSTQCMDRHAVDDALFRSQKDEIAVIFKNISLENSILDGEVIPVLILLRTSLLHMLA